MGFWIGRDSCARLALACLALCACQPDAQAQLAGRPPAVTRLVQAVEIIRRDYIDPVDDEKLVAGCLKGIATALGAVKSPSSAPDPAWQGQIAERLVTIVSGASPRVPGEEERTADACLRGVVDALDPLSAFMDSEEVGKLRASPKPMGGVGLEIRMQDGFPMVTATIEGSPAEKAGFKPGDVPVRIDNTSTEGLALAEIAAMLRGPIGSNLPLVVVRKGSKQPLTITVTRAIVRIPNVKWKAVAPGYAYIRINQFTDISGVLVSRAIQQALRENNGVLKGLLMDLRSNTGGLLNVSVGVSALFLPRGAPVAVSAGRSSRTNLMALPEIYLTNPKAEDYVVTAPPVARTVPLIVLVNEDTASGAEIVAAALQDHKRARIVGVRTSGADAVSAIWPLPGDTAIKLTYSRLYRPNGGPIGPVTPDSPLEPVSTSTHAFGTPDDIHLAHAIKVLEAARPPLK